MANRMTLKWNTPGACWIMDIADDAGTPLINGMAVVTGADLLEQFAYLKSMGISGQIIAQTDHDTDAVPTFANLGIAGRIYYLSP